MNGSVNVGQVRGVTDGAGIIGSATGPVALVGLSAVAVLLVGTGAALRVTRRRSV